MLRLKVLSESLDQLSVHDAVVYLLDSVLCDIVVVLHPARLIFNDFCKNNLQQQDSVLHQEDYNDQVLLF